MKGLPLDPSLSEGEDEKNILFFTIGVPGSGKSYFANAFCGKFGIRKVSSDGIRKEVTGSEADISQDNEVWRRVPVRLNRVLAETDCFFDATNYNVKNRRVPLNAAESNKAKTVAFFFHVPLSVCLERNKSRDRKVPEQVIENMHKGLTQPVPGEDVDLLVKVASVDKKDMLVQIVSKEYIWTGEVTWDKLLEQILKSLDS